MTNIVNVRLFSENQMVYQGLRHEFEGRGGEVSKSKGSRLFPFYCSFKTTCFAKK